MKMLDRQARSQILHLLCEGKLHSKLRTSPAIAAGISDRLWEIGGIVELIEADEAKIDRKRGTYKKLKK